MLQLLFLLLPIAAWSGWFWGRTGRAKEASKLAARLRKHYFVGLNYLINEQPDKAVDVFIKLLEVDHNTIETHLALGNLFRRRGEVDRAIRIHQNLIARPQLTNEQRIHALSELGQDYMRAGVLDRAERLFLQLVEMGAELESSLNYLLNIYQQEKDWQQAIKTAEKLAVHSSTSMQVPLAHFHCELAELEIKANRLEQARQYLKRALSTDKHCVRANLLQAQIEEQEGRYQQAIRLYKEISGQDVDFIMETIQPLARCYKFAKQEVEFVDYLQTCLLNAPSVSTVLALADVMQVQEGHEAALEFLADYVNKTPSLRVLHQFVKFYARHFPEAYQYKLGLLAAALARLSVNKPSYRCTECGVAVKTLYWQCPGCKDWSTVRPLMVEE